LFLPVPLGFLSAQGSAPEAFTGVGRQQSLSLEDDGPRCGGCLIDTASHGDAQFALEAKEPPSSPRLPFVKISCLWPSGSLHVGRAEVSPRHPSAVWLTTFRWKWELCVTLCRFRI
jgi:hypothetical protein